MSSSFSASEAPATKAGVEDSLRSYRLVEALRAGDSNAITTALESYPAEVETVRRGSEPLVSDADSGVGTSTPLHLAVRCAKLPAVEQVLLHSPASINSQDAKGSTPLHLAASLNRTDVVQLLLNSSSVDDSIRDVGGRTCTEVGGGSEVAGIISVSRAQYNEQYLHLLATYVASPSSEAATATPSNRRLSTQLPSPRSTTVSLLPSPPPAPSASFTLATPSPSSSTTTTAHHTSSASSISAASGHVSNLSGEKLYHFIQSPRSRSLDFSAQDGVSGTTVLHEAAKRKDLGIIKLVLARGGDVLARDRKGKLPVEVSRDDRIKNVLKEAANVEGQALKAASGSTHAAGPALGQPPAMRGYLSKWTNMARGYRSRWFVLDNGVLSYYRSQEEEGKASRGAISMTVARVLPPGSDKLKFEVSNKLGKSFPSFWLKGNHPVEVMRWVEVLRQNIEFSRDAQAMSRTGSISNASGYATSTTGTLEEVPKRTGTPPSPSASFGDRDGSIIGDDETFNGDGMDGVPRFEDFELLANGTKTQLEMTQQLFESLVVNGQGGSTSALPPPLPSSGTGVNSSADQQSDIKAALRGSLTSLRSMLDEYVDVVAQRERYFVRKYEREIDAKRLWEENMKEVAAQHSAMETELQKVGRDNTRRKRALQEVRANFASNSPLASPNSLGLGASLESSTNSEAEFYSGNEEAPPLRTSIGSNPNFRLSTLSQSDSTPVPSRSRSGTLSPSSPVRSRLRSSTIHAPLNPIELEQLVDSAIHGEADDSAEDSEGDEEFFEAIESGSIPVLESPTGVTSVPAEKYMEKMDLTPYKGYEHLREKLPIDNDNRPPVSLWAILKGSIGKDLTKISFPVFFNEPTSMLQRMSEDLEFSECLDSAACAEDASLRIAFVAAFAASNYSSTIGRIAKPFNPMLGETFEYVDLKKKYRYISEQVLHHPPISACIAQSPTWEYFGEVDAKSKFLGTSFEIRPTGIAHVNLRIPQYRAPDYPAVPQIPDLVVEHYSWTKVTTSVSNFLRGNPIIDHYGDLTVTNHRTGDTCTLTFKPRGWRGGNACEIKGKVVDRDGKPQWDIAGKWNSRLYARKSAAGQGDLATDVSIPNTAAGEAGYVLLWQNSVKPPGMPFNLTPFAITLNDTNPELKAWLPPTDCRLRPDQHAFESGLFEKANDLKTNLEEHQRATRRAREKGEVPEHRSRWFTRKRDKDTGESYWEPATLPDGNLEYWQERTRVGEAKKGGQETEWKGVVPIFADF